MHTTITTNNVPRPVIYGYELTEAEAAQFDYIEPDDLLSHAFFRYKGEVYDLNDFVRIVSTGQVGGSFAHYDHDGALKGWDGIATDSFFSATVIRYADEDCETVVVGLLCS